MDIEALEKGVSLNRKISEIEDNLRTINTYKGKASTFNYETCRCSISIEDRETKELVENIIEFKLTQKLQKLKKELEEL